MKITVLLIIVLLAFYGCEKDFDSVIQPENNSYQITSVTAFTEFNYFPGDSTRFLGITFNSAANVSSVRYDIFSPAGSKVNSTPISMIKSGPNSYSGTLVMSRNYINGNYTLKYFVTDISGSTREAALHKFSYNNGSTNSPPVIANASVNPDAVTVTGSESVDITVTVEASDPDGSNDIELVYFIVFRPDGTTSGTQNVLNDNGVKITGSAWDETAGDGIYSNRFSVNNTSQKGLWRIEFRARDRSKQVSNLISLNFLIQ
jgi:uncharacterized protein YfaS (alpha-2-macroglobulin family)